MKNSRYHIAVCDDEAIDRERIREMADEVCSRHHIAADIRSFSSAGDLLCAMQQGDVFALLLLDVMMPEQDGMALARQLRSQKLKTVIVFISSNREMALRGYEVSALRYLAKPVDMERLEEAICFCHEQYTDRRELLISCSSGIRKVSPEKICYVEITGRKRRIVQMDGVCDTEMSMDELASMLSGKNFIRCHQSFLVNCQYIRTLSSSDLELTNGKLIPVSKHRIKDVKKQFFEYMNG